MFLFAVEYEYPGVVPEHLPNNPFKFGPTFKKYQNIEIMYPKKN